MNKKKMFKEAYAPPEPLHKEEFLRHAPIQPVSTTAFILSQIRYIRRWVWGLDIVLLFYALIGTFFLQWKILYELSAQIKDFLGMESAGYPQTKKHRHQIRAQ